MAGSIARLVSAGTSIDSSMGLSGIAIRLTSAFLRRRIFWRERSDIPVGLFF
jgi:hypothetical protein